MCEYLKYKRPSRGEEIDLLKKCIGRLRTFYRYTGAVSYLTRNAFKLVIKQIAIMHVPFVGSIVYKMRHMRFIKNRCKSRDGFAQCILRSGHESDHAYNEKEFTEIMIKMLDEDPEII